MIKELLQKRREKIKAKKRIKYQLMRAEIIGAIQAQVINEQKCAEINIPFFLEVQSRCDKYDLKTVGGVCRTYAQFLKQGLIKGAINV